MIVAFQKIIEVYPYCLLFFTNILYYRLIKWIETNKHLSIFQAGSRAGFSTVDQIFALSSIAKKYIDNNKKLFAFFVDFKAAFDTVNRNSLLYKLSNLGLSSKFLRLYKQLVTNTCSSVWNGTIQSDFFNTETGVPQGCVLSPILFAIFIDDVSRTLPGGAKIGNLNVNVLLYADDLVLLTDNPSTLQLQINRLIDYCNLWDLEINTGKSK